MHAPFLLSAVIPPPIFLFVCNCPIICFDFCPYSRLFFVLLVFYEKRSKTNTTVGDGFKIAKFGASNNVENKVRYSTALAYLTRVYVLVIEYQAATEQFSLNLHMRGVTCLIVLQ